MEERKIKPVALLQGQLETSLITQVLRDEQIPFQVELNQRGLGSIMGAAFDSYARLWGREQDEEAILSCLKDVRESTVIDNKDYLVNGRMWRIKKT
ncbi:MAG: hypothetical protein IK116_07305 [Firmicutes bacterium]|nr:hypothetical protein [Bacillota bacterium]